MLLLSICCIYSNGYTPYLTPGQWGSIRRILTHPDTPIHILQKTRKVIYIHYEKWAFHRTTIFRENRRGLCRRIFNSELSIYASRGLIKAIEKCDFSVLQNTPFSKYASKWVDYELLDGMTELQPLTVLPKRLRKRKGIHDRHSYRIEHLGNRDYILSKQSQFYTRNYGFTHEYDDAWEKVNTVVNSSFAQRAFRLKFSETFVQMRTNAEVAELMASSEETVRDSLKMKK
jgi:hypothetical protein